MKIICPECSASFDVPVSLISDAGKRMRCGACGHIWVYTKPEEKPAFGGFRAMEDDLNVEPIPSSLHPSMDDGEDNALKIGLLAGIHWPALGRMVAGFLFGALVSLACVAGLGAIHKTPGFLTPVAAALGFSEDAPSFAGLELRNIAAQSIEATHDAEAVIRVRGTIYNDGEHTSEIPLVSLTIISADGEEIINRRVKPEQGHIKSQESVPFVQDIPGTITNGAQLRAEFVSE